MIVMNMSTCIRFILFDILYDTSKFDECFRLNCVLTEFTLNVGFKL